MVMQGETIATGAPRICLECMEKIKPGVYMSAAGHYIGAYCGCGPYSRESRYYPNRIKAMEAYETGNYGRI